MRAGIVNIGNCMGVKDATFCKNLQIDTCVQQMVATIPAQCLPFPGHLNPVTTVTGGFIKIVKVALT